MINRNHPRHVFNIPPSQATRLEITAHILKCFEREVREREVGIANYAAKEGDNGEAMNLMEAAILYDGLAPLVSTKDMLLHCGIIIDDYNKEYEDLPFLLNCLAALNIFVVKHEHLTNDELWDALCNELNEEQNFLPPSESVNEFWSLHSYESKNINTKSLRTVPTPLQNITDAIIEQRNTRKDTQ